MEILRKTIGAAGMLQIMVGASILDSPSMVPGALFVIAGVVLLLTAEVVMK